MLPMAWSVGCVIGLVFSFVGFDRTSQVPLIL
jgi:hypothetical protein